MDSPGITVRPIETMHGAPEFCEVFFDDVVVPEERMLGGEGEGWAVAMDLLPYERSTALWHRGAMLQRRFEQLLEAAPADSLDPSWVGEVALTLRAFRARSRSTQYRLHSGEQLGPETSVDKVLLATTEQAVFDLAEHVLSEAVLTGDDGMDERWRSEFMYSPRRRSTAEVPRSSATSSPSDFWTWARSDGGNDCGEAMMDSEDRELFERSFRMVAESCQDGHLNGELEALGWTEAFEEDGGQRPRCSSRCRGSIT